MFLGNGGSLKKKKHGNQVALEHKTKEGNTNSKVYLATRSPWKLNERGSGDSKQVFGES